MDNPAFVPSENGSPPPTFTSRSANSLVVPTISDITQAADQYNNHLLRVPASYCPTAPKASRSAVLPCTALHAATLQSVQCTAQPTVKELQSWYYQQHQLLSSSPTNSHPFTKIKGAAPSISSARSHLHANRRHRNHNSIVHKSSSTSSVEYNMDDRNESNEMSKPENNANALNWRRLHLSKAKLKASSRTSALLSGFAMVAMVEIQLQKDIPQALLVAFAVCTTLLVSVHMMALMISTCILPNLEAVASIHGLAAVAESPHEKMHNYIEVAWAFSTVIGILLFMCEIAIICWVVFYNYSKTAAIAGTMILIPVVVLFLMFALHFYRNLVTHKFERSIKGVEELENLATQLQNDIIHV